MKLFNFFSHGKKDDDDDSYDSNYENYEYDDDEDEGESLNVWDAADIWLSNGMDEDYMFGYSEEELRRAAGMD